MIGCDYDTAATLELRVGGQVSCVSTMDRLAGLLLELQGCQRGGSGYVWLKQI